MYSTGELVGVAQWLARQSLAEGLPTRAGTLSTTASRLRDFAELIAFLTGRDADEYLQAAKNTGYPPLTSTTDVRTTVLGDSAPTNEIPK
jgi:hypothetical protein